MIKKILAYLLLSIISFQLLPLKEVGAIFYGNQMIEEICNTSADGDGKSAEGSEDLKKSDLFCHRIHFALPFETALKDNKNPARTDYVSRLADDIPTPPPLQICFI
ncbi:MAG: hypothetical protein LW815_04635 [Chitinophagaceae bacterium]|nr:hypothetical protein [Chitinophagaceae bacterium]